MAHLAAVIACSLPLSVGMHVYTASQLTPLLHHLATTVAQAPLAPRESELVVVQSQGMRRWVTLQLADRFGCAASLALPFPTAFVRDMERRTRAAAHTTTWARTDADRFTRDVLTWRIDLLLRALPTDTVYAPLHRYLRGADERARFGLAAQLAARFDDYQLFRADVLTAWETGSDPIGTTHTAWQRALWRTLCGAESQDAGHLAARLQRTITAIRSGTRSTLPTRVTVFGVSTLPPAFLELLAALSAHIPVSVYTAALHTGTSQTDTLGTGTLKGTHPLALALGAQGREFLDLLRAQGATVHTLEPEGDTAQSGTPHSLLRALQREMVAGESTTPLALTTTDRSLTIHDAHGQIRQLEVLRDQLLAALADDATLRPHDLLLLVPDATEWAPLVDAVFGGSAGDRTPLPYRIADRPSRRTQPAMEAFGRLLALEGGRLARSEVLSLLALPLLRQGADLSEGELDLLESLTGRANVRWGYDAQSRAALGLPAFEEASWRAGLDRLLLGTMVGRTAQPVLDLLPSAGDTSGDPETVAKLAQWVDRLAATLRSWREPRPLGAWSDAFNTAIDLLFDTTADQQSIEALRAVLQRLRALAEQSAHHEPVSFGVVRDWLEQLLDDDGHGAGFLMGGMTVAALKPMRSLPFRVIAVAGLDDGVFPRRDRRTAFDLLEMERRPGDRDLRSDDRQLFLDLLLAAQDRLILSFSGRAVRDNSPCAPSVVVDELLDYLDRHSDRLARTKLVVSHPLQPFSQEYFGATGDADDTRDANDGTNGGADADANAGALFSYSRMYAAAARARAERDQAEEPGDAPDRGHTSNAVAPSPGVGGHPAPASPSTITLTLDELADCWSNPSRYYCRHALHLTLPSDLETLPDDEPFALDALREGGVRFRLLNTALARAALDRDDERLRTRLAADGLLPLGALGDAWYDRLNNDVQQVLAGIPPVEPRTVPITLHGERWQLVGRIEQLRDDTRIVARAGSVRPAHRIRAWVEHVVMCAAHELGDSELAVKTMVVGKQTTKKYKADLRIGAVANAAAVLDTLVHTALAARVRPLPFFPQAAWAYHDAVLSAESKRPRVPFDEAHKAYHKTRTHFSPVGGDQDDPYIAYCFRDTNPMHEQFAEFEQLVQLLFGAWPAPEQGA